MATALASLYNDPKSEAKKPHTVAGRWGQVPTPEPIAIRMAKRLFRGRPTDGIRILDPCVGRCTFPKALMRAGVCEPRDELTLIDIDREMVTESSQWVRSCGLRCSLRCADYIEVLPEADYDYAILNPPYVRQEWLARKTDYWAWFDKRYSLRVPGTSNLYVYFIVKVLSELRPGGQLACIVYDSWQFTRFGHWLLEVFEKECDNIALEAESNQPFNGRLIDATVIYAQKKRSPQDQFSRWASTLRRKVGPLSSIQGFSPLSGAFQTRRGLRLKQADFFLCDPVTAIRCRATPFVKKIAKVDGYRVPENHPEAALLLRPGDRKPLIKKELERRLSEAHKEPSDNLSVLTWFRERPQSWMFHRPAPHADILFNYYMRQRPKHILSAGHAYSDNFYGLTSHEEIPTTAWLAVLNSTASGIEILSRARNQGNGLAKVQLFEYRDAYIPDLRLCSRRDLKQFEQLGIALVNGTDPLATIRHIDEAVAAVFANSRLRSTMVYGIFREIDESTRKPRDSA